MIKEIINIFTTLSKKLLLHFDNITKSSFAFGVAEEFILISIITVVSYMMNWYSLWIGLFIYKNLKHLFINIKNSGREI